MSGKRKAASPARKSNAPKGAAAKGAGDTAPWKRRLRKTAKWTGITGLVLVLIGAVAFVVLYNTIEVPDPNSDFQTETTYVYYSDGKKEIGRYAQQNRNSIPLSEMPDAVKDGVVAAENRSFWTDNGLDFKGIIRAALSNTQGNGRQGASTITQQYVKILYLSSERSYTRKIKEAFVSLKLVRQQSKEEILEGYLNTIYFGRGAYGIDAAAQAFFAKPAKKLSTPESAVLASVINNPTRFDPANGEDSEAALLQRYRYVLSGMAESGSITPEQADRLGKELPEFPEIKGESTYAGQRGHALEMIKRELVKLGFSEQEINAGGLRVTTTLKKKVMQANEKAVKNQGPKGKGLHVATASVEPGTGALRGFYGGQDYLDSQINWAVSGGSPGSTFKLFALAAGLEAGFSLKDTFEGNSPYRFKSGGGRVRNQGDTNYGRVNLIQATEDSVNTAFADLTMELPDGPRDVLKMAHKMGIPKWDKSQTGMDHLRTSPGLVPNGQIALGSATVSPINMANGYATIANRGKVAEVYLIDKVVDRTGEVRYRHKNSTERVLDQDLADDTSYALQQVIKSGSGTKALALGRPAGGKTGTATNSKDKVSSSWFVGYTPQLSTAVMITKGTGNESIEEAVQPFFGGTFPTLIWTEAMERALKGAEVKELPSAKFVDGDAPSRGHAPPPPPAPETNQPEPSESASESASTSPSPSKSTQAPSTTPTPSNPPPPDPSDPCTLLGCPSSGSPQPSEEPSPSGPPGQNRSTPASRE
ncbi:MAG TPA: transglycosylase domain-containing protein [Nocardioides sp.]